MTDAGLIFPSAAEPESTGPNILRRPARYRRHHKSVARPGGAACSISTARLFFALTQDLFPTYGKQVPLLNHTEPDRQTTQRTEG